MAVIPRLARVGCDQSLVSHRPCAAKFSVGPVGGLVLNRIRFNRSRCHFPHLFTNKSPSRVCARTRVCVHTHTHAHTSLGALVEGGLAAIVTAAN